MGSGASYHGHEINSLTRNKGSGRRKFSSDKAQQHIKISEKESKMLAERRFRILDGTRVWGVCHRYLPDETLPTCSKEELNRQELSSGYILPKLEWYTKQCEAEGRDSLSEPNTNMMEDEISIEDVERMIKVCRENVTSSVKLIKESKKSICEMSNPKLYEMYCRPCLDIPSWFLNIFRKGETTEYGYRTFMLNATFPKDLEGASEEYEQITKMLFTLCIKLNVPDCPKPRFYKAQLFIQEQFHVPSGKIDTEVDKLKKSWREMYTCEKAAISSCNERRVQIEGNYIVEGVHKEFSIVFLREWLTDTIDVTGTYMRQMLSCEKFLTWKISDNR